jgi:predicted enzyme related to lactoylglutathione lyase
MAVCRDPNGAEFDIWESKKGQGTDVDTSLHGAPSWFENLASDVARGIRFYSQVFGWNAAAKPMPGFEYTTFERGGGLVAGMMPILPEMGSLRPFWDVYFTVKDVVETARLAVELGGTLTVPVQEVPGVGRFCGVTSPQGVNFSAITYSR